MQDERAFHEISRQDAVIGELLTELAVRNPWHGTKDLVWALHTAVATDAPRAVAVALVRRAQELTRSYRLTPEMDDGVLPRGLAMLGHAMAAAATSAGLDRETTRGVEAAVLDGRSLLLADQHALAFTTLGAAALSDRDRDSVEARTVLRYASTRLHLPRLADPWLWPEPERRAADGVLPHALMAAGRRLDESGLVRNGLLMLDWRLAYPLEAADEEPVLTEAYFLLGACREAYGLTGDAEWERRGRERALAALAGTLPDRLDAGIDPRPATALRRHLLVTEVLRAGGPVRRELVADAARP